MPENPGDERSESYSEYRKSLEQQTRDQVRAQFRRGPWKGHGPRQGVVFAVLMIVVGFLWFLDNLGFFHFQDVWQYWPLAVIAVGVAKLFDACGVAGRTWAAMWILVGTAFLLDHLHIWHVGWNMIWPLALVGFGVTTLINALQHRRPADGSITHTTEGTAVENTLREWATFSGIKRRVETQNFQGGEAVAVFGGLDIDLRKAIIAPGVKQVVIDANATFGGIEFRVPETWLVVTRGTGLFGGYEDKTSPPPAPDAPILVIKGYAIFGGIAVRN